MLVDLLCDSVSLSNEQARGMLGKERMSKLPRTHLLDPLAKREGNRDSHGDHGCDLKKVPALHRNLVDRRGVKKPRWKRTAGIDKDHLCCSFRTSQGLEGNQAKQGQAALVSRRWEKLICVAPGVDGIGGGLIDEPILCWRLLKSMACYTGQRKRFLTESNLSRQVL